jgi:hypothetical protein
VTVLANSLQPGTWAELVTNNIAPTLAFTGGASGYTFRFTENRVWRVMDDTGVNNITAGTGVHLNASRSTIRILLQKIWCCCSTELLLIHLYSAQRIVI